MQYIKKNKDYKASQWTEFKYIENERQNIKTDLITITKDKLENILLKYSDQSKKRPDWKTPFSVFITTLLSVLTSDFNDFLLQKENWKVLYILIIICSFISFLVNLIRCIKNSKRNSIDSLINQIANIKNDNGV